MESNGCPWCDVHPLSEDIMLSLGWVHDSDDDCSEELCRCKGCDVHILEKDLYDYGSDDCCRFCWETLAICEICERELCMEHDTLAYEEFKLAGNRCALCTPNETK